MERDEICSDAPRLCRLRIAVRCSLFAVRNFTTCNPRGEHRWSTTTPREQGGLRLNSYVLSCQPQSAGKRQYQLDPSNPRERTEHCYGQALEFSVSNWLCGLSCGASRSEGRCSGANNHHWPIDGSRPVSYSSSVAILDQFTTGVLFHIVSPAARLVVYLRPPRPLPRPAEPRPGLGQSALACPFWPHLKHSMLLISRPAGLRPPLSDVRRSRLASSLTGLEASLGDASWLFRDSRFLEDISRFVSRISSAVGSSES